MSPSPEPYIDPREAFDPLMWAEDESGPDPWEYHYPSEAYELEEAIFALVEALSGS